MKQSMFLSRFHWEVTSARSSIFILFLFFKQTFKKAVLASQKNGREVTVPIYPMPPHMHSLHSHIPPEWGICGTDEPAFPHHHPEAILYIRVHYFPPQDLVRHNWQIKITYIKHVQHGNLIHINLWLPQITQPLPHTVTILCVYGVCWGGWVHLRSTQSANFKISNTVLLMLVPVVHWIPWIFSSYTEALYPLTSTLRFPHCFWSFCT